MIELTQIEKERFEQWIKENVAYGTVPNDEGNEDALIFNLVHSIRGDNQKFNYKPEQQAEIASWGLR